MPAQQLERVQVPSSGRQDQRRDPVPVLRVGADALLQQPLHVLGLVVLRGGGQLVLLLLLGGLVRLLLKLYLQVLHGKREVKRLMLVRCAVVLQLRAITLLLYPIDRRAVLA